MYTKQEQRELDRWMSRRLVSETSFGSTGSLELSTLIALAKEGKARVLFVTRHGISQVVIVADDQSIPAPEYYGTIDAVAEAAGCSGEVLNDISSYYRWHQIPRFREECRKTRNGGYPHKREATIRRVAMQIVTDLLGFQIQWQRDGSTQFIELGTFTPRERRPDMLRIMRFTKPGRAACERHKKEREQFFKNEEKKKKKREKEKKKL